MSNPSDRLFPRLARYRTLFAKRPFLATAKIAAICMGSLCEECAARVSEALRSTSGKKFKVAFKMSGGVGDMLVNALYVREFAKLDERNLDIAVVSKSEDILRGIFFGQNLSPTYARKIGRAEFDAVVSLVRYPVLERLRKGAQKKSPDTFSYLLKISDFGNGIPSANSHAYPADFISTHLEILRGHRRNNQPDIYGLLRLRDKKFNMLCALPIKDTLGKFGLAKIPYLTFQRGAQNASDETKIMSAAKYSELLRILGRSFPRLKFVQIGRSDTVSVPEAHIDLRGRTNFEELKVVLKESLLHIDCECGMVHMKHSLGGTSLVFFGPTSEKFASYDGNINVSGKVCGGFCEWISPDWRTRCPVFDTDKAPCMEAIDINSAAEKAARFIAPVLARRETSAELQSSL